MAVVCWNVSGSGGEGVGFCYGSFVGVYVEVRVTMLVVGDRFNCLLLCCGSGS